MGGAVRGGAGVLLGMRSVSSGLEAAHGAASAFARRLVSRKKRRFTEGGHDLDLSYVTESIIAMGFPAGDPSSGWFIDRVEGFYRNRMEDVVRFLDERHAGQFKVFNLCSERLYDPGRFGGLVACFPFDDHNCPPLRLIRPFCESAKAWLAGGLERVVVVHCKAGKSRTGLMVCALLVHIGFCASAGEATALYNLKRTQDGKGLTLPSQRRYLGYYAELLARARAEGSPGAEPGPGRRLLLAAARLRGGGEGLLPGSNLPGLSVSGHDGEVFFPRGAGAEGADGSAGSGPGGGDARKGRARHGGQWHNLDESAVEMGLEGVVVQGDFKVKFHSLDGDYWVWLSTVFVQEGTLELPAAELDHYDRRLVKDKSLVCELIFLSA